MMGAASTMAGTTFERFALFVSSFGRERRCYADL